MSISAGSESNSTVNTDPTSNGTTTYLPDGGFVTVFVGDDGSSFGVFQQRYAVDGTAIGGQTRVNTITENDQRAPKVVALADGGWVVVWQTRDIASNTGWDISQQRYSSNGEKVGAETEVVPNFWFADDEVSPQVTALPNGGWVVSYFDEADLGLSYARASFYGADGALVNDWQAASDVVGYSSRTLAFPNGGWVTISEVYRGSATKVDIVVSGQTASGDVISWQPGYSTNHQQGADAALLPNGGFVLVWMSEDDDGDKNTVYQQVFDANGHASIADAKVSTDASFRKDDASVTVLADGGWVVTWTSFGQDGSSGGIYQQVYDAGGQRVGTETLVNQTTVGEQSDARSVALEDGGWMVVWTSQGTLNQRTFHIVNDAPSGSDATFTIEEDGSHRFAPADFGFADSNGDGLKSIVVASLPQNGVLSLSGVAVSKNQSIAAADLANLVWKPAGNANGSALASFTFKVVDDGGSENGGADTSQAAYTITFNVTPVADAPSTPTLSGTAVNENVAIGTTVGTFSAKDPDGGALSYALTDTAGGLYKLSGNKLVTARAINYEALASKSDTVTLRVTDPGGLSTTKTFTIRVQDVNETPTSLALSRATIAENSKAGTTVGTFSAKDPEGKALSYKLTDTAGGLFKISGNQLQVARAADFEKLKSDSVTVQVSDGANTLSKTFVIAITDVIDQITGTSKADTLKGGSGIDLIKAGAGNDLLYGYSGNDTLKGEENNDTLHGGAGADRLDGGAGTDTVSYADASKAVTASLAKASINTGYAMGDSYVSVENLTGTIYADKLTGNNSANVLNGSSGNDVLKGEGGADTLLGEKGADDLYGGSGKDLFVFKALTDSTVKSSGRDTIFDFQAGSDLIDVSGIDANAKSSGNQKFSFIHTDSFHGKPGELRFVKNGSETYVHGDVDGDRKADLAIHIDSLVTLKTSDFLL